MRRWVLAVVLVLMLAGGAGAEPKNPSGIGATTGNFWVNHIWSDPMYLIAGEGVGTFNGFEWGGSAWTSNSGIISGLSDPGQDSAPAVFHMGGTTYLISGNNGGTFSGYHWTGSAWTSNSGIISGLGDVGTWSKPTVFEISGTWYLISGEMDTTFNGFTWTGSTWQTNATIISGLSADDRDTPTVFEKDGTLYLISGTYDGTFSGYYWTGSAWTSNSGIISGLVDVGTYSAPSVIEKDDTWYLVSGNNGGTFVGYHWTGSAWTSDSGIISGLVDVGYHSTPEMFIIYSDIGDDDIDTYNVSINSVWHNTTTNTYLNNSPLSPHAWSNVTTFSFNDTSGLSSTSVSQDVQIPNNPITITNMGDWDGYINHTVTVDCNADDADSDSPTFSCNRTDLFTNYDTGNGEGSWYATTIGTYHVDFGVSDGHGSTDNYTMTIDVAALDPSAYIAITSGGYRSEDNFGVTYVYVDNPDLLPCLVTLGESLYPHASSTSAATQHIPGETLWCYEAGTVSRYWANGTQTDTTRYQNTPTTPWCDFGCNAGPQVTTSMLFTNMSDYMIVYGYVTDPDVECWRCDPTVDNTRVFLYIHTTPSTCIILYDHSRNLIQHAQVTVHNTTTNEIVHLWEDIDNGIIDMGITTDTFQVAVRTFDGVFVHTCDLGANPVCEISLPIHYNVRVYPVDEYEKPLTDVFAGLAEYTPLDPQAFWGYSMTGSQYVPITNCSGFAICDLIVEKGGYESVDITALNWTSRNALVKDYRHTAVMQEEGSGGVGAWWKFW